MTEPYPPAPHVKRPGRWVPSLVWTIPVLAALIGLSLVAQALWQRGPTITVTFATAEGIEPGKTKVKFKNVDIGEVKAVHLSDDRTHVVATIDLVKEARRFAVADSRFWVVRPRLAGTGVSGLGTVLSGSYIGADGGHSDKERDAFTGLEDPPTVTSDVPGRRYRLHAEDIGSLDVGSPVYFRRIQVGHVESFALEPDGHRISMGIFVKSPYDRFVTEDSRFWHASGFDLRFDASGVRLETQSLATIMMGGISFETPPGNDSARAAAADALFTLAADHAEALKPPDGPPKTVLLRFQQSVRGLTVGAPVDFRGVEIGRVRSVDIVFDQATGTFFSPVLVDLYPSRLSKGPPGKLEVLEKLVRRGLRAQLRTGNLLTGQLYVALDIMPGAPRARFDATADPPELPTVQGEMEELQQQFQAIVRKLEKIPFDTLGEDAHRAMVSLDAALRRVDALAQKVDAAILPELQQTMRDMHRTMEALQGSVAGDAPLQQDTRQALRGVTEATRALKALTDSLERNPEALLRGKKDTSR
jgi:Paraquat-inducible protein B